jgi:hypothetical protein
MKLCTNILEPNNLFSMFKYSQSTSKLHVKSAFYLHNVYCFSAQVHGVTWDCFFFSTFVVQNTADIEPLQGIFSVDKRPLLHLQYLNKAVVHPVISHLIHLHYIEHLFQIPSRNPSQLHNKTLRTALPRTPFISMTFTYLCDPQTSR